MRVYGKTACFAAGLAACLIVTRGASLGAVGMGSNPRAERVIAERVIEDPNSGRRWILAKDPQHPGGPGTLVEQRASEGVKSSATQKAPLVIHSGDRVLVEEKTRVARGLFEAIALSTARQGASFRVRLRVGGRVVRAIATGPGRAMLAGADEVEQ